MEGRPRWFLGGLADAPRVARLAAGAFDPFYQEAWNLAQIDGLLRQGDSWLELAEGPNGALLAFALCRQVLDEVELLLCAADRNWRRRGIGLELIRRAAERSAAKGGSRLFLEVRASNEAALALYRKAGMREDGRRPAYYHTRSGESIDAITLSIGLFAPTVAEIG